MKNKNSAARLIFFICVFLLVGCATAEDVRQASDLIRTDNELTRLLVEKKDGLRTPMPSGKRLIGTRFGEMGLLPGISRVGRVEELAVG